MYILFTSTGMSPSFTSLPGLVIFGDHIQKLFIRWINQKLPLESSVPVKLPFLLQACWDILCLESVCVVSVTVFLLSWPSLCWGQKPAALADVCSFCKVSSHAHCPVSAFMFFFICCSFTNFVDYIESKWLIWLSDAFLVSVLFISASIFLFFLLLSLDFICYAFCQFLKI